MIIEINQDSLNDVKTESVVVYDPFTKSFKYVALEDLHHDLVKENKNLKEENEHYKLFIDKMEKVDIYNVLKKLDSSDEKLIRSSALLLLLTEIVADGIDYPGNFDDILNYVKGYIPVAPSGFEKYIDDVIRLGEGGNEDD